MVSYQRLQFITVHFWTFASVLNSRNFRINNQLINLISDRLKWSEDWKHIT